MSDSAILDPFHRELYKRIEEELQRRQVQLSTGSAFALAGDVRSTGEKYSEQVAYVNALLTVLEFCQEIEQERHQLNTLHTGEE